MMSAGDQANPKSEQTLRTDRTHRLAAIALLLSAASMVGTLLNGISNYLAFRRSTNAAMALACKVVLDAPIGLHPFPFPEAPNRAIRLRGAGPFNIAEDKYSSVISL